MTKTRPLVVKKGVFNFVVRNQTGLADIRNTLITNFNLLNSVKHLNPNTRKKRIHNSCDSTKLEMNYKRSFNKAVTKRFYKINFKDYGN